MKITVEIPLTRDSDNSNPHAMQIEINDDLVTFIVPDSGRELTFTREELLKLAELAK